MEQESGSNGVAERMGRSWQATRRGAIGMRRAWREGCAGAGKLQGAGRTGGAIGTESAYVNRVRNEEYQG